MSRHIPPRRVPRDRFIFSGGGGSGSVFSGAVPGAHTHLEVDITDLDKFSQAAADARFSPLVHTHVKADITDFAHTHLEADITDLKDYLEKIGGTMTGDLQMGNGADILLDNNTGGLFWRNAADTAEVLVFWFDSSNRTRQSQPTLFASTVDVAGALTQGGTAVSLVGHTHTEFLPITGGTLTGDLEIASLSPTLSLFDTDEASVDEKNWELFSAFGRITLRAVNDAGSATADVWTVLRLGMTMEQFDIKADRATHNGLDLAHQNSVVNLKITKNNALFTLDNNTPTGAASLHFAESGASRFIMGSQESDNTFKLNFGGSIASRNDFVMSGSTGQVSFNLAPTVGGLAVTLVGHTHLEADITDLKAYLVSPLTTAGDLLVFTSVDARLAVGTEGQVLTSTAGNPTWATPASGVTDHGLLTGLGDDDHTQYHTDARGDARYPLLGHTHLEADITDLKAYLELAGGQMSGNLTIKKSFPFVLINATGGTNPGVSFQDDDVTEYIMGHVDSPHSFKINLGTSLATRDDFVMDVAGKVSFGVTPAAGGTDVSLEGHTHPFSDITGVVDADLLDGLDSTAFASVVHGHLEADITDLQNYSVVGHTHGEIDIVDLKDYLVSPLNVAGDILFFNGGHQRLAKGLDTEVLTLVAGVPAWVAPATGVTDHGALTGLGDDDHTQYLLKTGGTLTGDLTLSKSNPLFLLNTTDTTDSAILFQDIGVSRYVMGYSNSDNTFRLNILGSVGGRTDFIMENTGRVAFAQTPVVTGVKVELEGHTHLEADITDLKAYLELAGGTVSGLLSVNVGADAVSKLEIGEPTVLRGNAQDGQLKLFGENAGAIVFSDITHTGAHLQFNGTGFLQINSMDGLDILAGGILRVRNSSNISRGDWSHDGTNFNLAFTSTADYNLTGLTGQLEVDGVGVLLKSGGELTGTLTTNSPIKIESASPNIRWHETDATVDEGRWQMTARDDVLQLRSQNDAETTSANFLEVRRTGIVIDSMTFLTKTADFRLVTNFNINAEAAATTFLEIGEPTVTRGDAQGAKLIMWGENASSVLTKFIFFASGGNMALTSSGTGSFQASVNFEINQGKFLRVRDAGNTDWGQWSHSGADFNLALVNTSSYNITGIGNLFTVDGSTRIPNSSSYRALLAGSGSSMALIGADTLDRVLIDGSSKGTKINSKVGFNGVAPINKPNVLGSRGGNAALAALLNALASYGLITNSTT